MRRERRVRCGVRGKQLAHIRGDTCAPPIHQKMLGKILFGKMLNEICPNVGPYKNSAGSSLMYLLR